MEQSYWLEWTRTKPPHIFLYYDDWNSILVIMQFVCFFFVLFFLFAFLMFVFCYDTEHSLFLPQRKWNYWNLWFFSEQIVYLALLYSIQHLGSCNWKKKKKNNYEIRKRMHLERSKINNLLNEQKIWMKFYEIYRTKHI